MNLFLFIKLLSKAFRRIKKYIDNVVCHLILKINDVAYNGITTYGVPVIRVSRTGRMIIGKDFRMNNGTTNNIIGYNNPCSFIVGDKAELIIGDMVGMSQTAIVSTKSIRIGNNVKIGGGVKIYDTDFHSINWKLRRNRETDFAFKKKEPITIGNDVFIGAGSMILKGVNIGDRSIVAAGSIVTKSIPQDEMWGGNPARFIRKMEI